MLLVVWRFYSDLTNNSQFSLISLFQMQLGKISTTNGARLYLSLILTFPQMISGNHCNLLNLFLYNGKQIASINVLISNFFNEFQQFLSLLLIQYPESQKLGFEYYQNIKPELLQNCFSIAYLLFTGYFSLVCMCKQERHLKPLWIHSLMEFANLLMSLCKPQIMGNELWQPLSVYSLQNRLLLSISKK